MGNVKDKCECGSIASHTVYGWGKDKRLCCACYVKAGNPPTDWHIGCMRAYGREKEVVNLSGLPERKSSLI